MSLTVQDILGRTFTVKFRGYDPREVDDFLKEVAQALTNCLNDLEGLRKKEEDFRQVLAAAHSMSEEMKTQAERERKLKLEKASLEAERLVTDARQEVARIEGRIRELRRIRDDARARARSVLEGYLRMLDEEIEPSEDIEDLLKHTATELEAIQAEIPEGRKEEREV